MAETYKVLGQSAPSATTDTDLYTAGSTLSAITSTLTVCNRGTAVGNYRVAIRPDGTAIANQHYLVYDAPLDPNDTVTMTLGLTLSADDVVTVSATTADFSFNLFGTEIS